MNDEEVTIGRPGGFYTYYIVAHTGFSPESEPSDEVFIRGNPSKPLPSEDENNLSHASIEEQISALEICICPNPFNPTTKISYDVRKAGLIQKTVYNMTGQKVADLVNEFIYPGDYSVNFEGQSLAGGVYLVRSLIDEQKITRKILLFK